MTKTKSAQLWEKVTAFAFGLVFVAVLLILAFSHPVMTSQQFTIVRIVLAAALAGVASVIPGILNVRLRGEVRAGGALAVFVIVYFFTPELIG